MGTGSVDDRYGSGDSCCRRCLSPFSGGDTGAPWKKGTGTEPAVYFHRFGICEARSQSPFSTPRLLLEVRSSNRGAGGPPAMEHE